MKLTDVRYEIEGLNIPDAPLKERDSAKLMVLNKAQQTIEHRSFSGVWVPNERNLDLFTHRFYQLK